MSYLAIKGIILLVGFLVLGTMMLVFSLHKRKAWSTTGKPCPCKFCYYARGGP